MSMKSATVNVFPVALEILIFCRCSCTFKYDDKKVRNLGFVDVESSGSLELD